jgi:hypothetical protein
VISESPLPATNGEPYFITPGPDGALWFTEMMSNKIGRLGLPTFTLSVAAVPSRGGTTTGGGSGPFMALSSQTVTATANPGYAFVNWTQAGNVVSTSPSYTFTLAGNFALVANFVPTTAAHDFNGDGKSDIVWFDTSSNIAVWLMNGTTVTNYPTSLVGTVPSQWGIVGQRDFNGDGYADFLARDTSGNVSIWLMNGTTTLNQGSGLVANVPAQWSIVGTADFNGDGKGDILWQDNSGNVAIWEMNGTTILNPNSAFVGNVASQWSIAGTGDFDGDGKADILWLDTSGNVAIWLMNGTTILNVNSSLVSTVSGGQWSIKGTGDFNGDGMSDILWQDASGNVVIWLMNGTSVSNWSSTLVGTVAGQWSIQFTGDFNGDGKSDILWQDTSGDVAIWEMNGITVLNQNSSFVANVAGPWSIQHLNAD